MTLEKDLSVALVAMLLFSIFTLGFITDYIKSRGSVDLLEKESKIKDFREKVEGLSQKFVNIGSKGECFPFEATMNIKFFRRIIITQPTINLFLWKIPPNAIVTDFADLLVPREVADVLEDTLIAEHNKGIFFNFTVFVIEVVNENENCGTINYKLQVTNCPENFECFFVKREELAKLRSHTDIIKYLDNNLNDVARVEDAKSFISRMEDVQEISLNPKVGSTKNYAILVVAIPTYDLNLFSKGIFMASVFLKFDDTEVIRKDVGINIK